MSTRKLKWVKGTPCKGIHYYLHAWHNDIMYTLARVTVNDEDTFEVWKKGEMQGSFKDRREALQFAEGLL
jgi:hypothetical protein